MVPEGREFIFGTIGRNIYLYKIKIKEFLTNLISIGYIFTIKDW